jgi:hypothetical protein
VGRVVILLLEVSPLLKVVAVVLMKEVQGLLEVLVVAVVIILAEVLQVVLERLVKAMLVEQGETFTPAKTITILVEGVAVLVKLV